MKTDLLAAFGIKQALYDLETLTGLPHTDWETDSRLTDEQIQAMALEEKNI